MTHPWPKLLATLVLSTLLSTAHAGPDYGRKDPAWIVRMYGRQKDAIEREAMMLSLVDRVDPSVLPTLLRAAKDPSADVRYAAARALQSNREAASGPEAAATWLSLLDDTEDRTRTIAVDALATIMKDPRSTELRAALIALSQDAKSWRCRRGAVLAVGESPAKDAGTDALLISVARTDPNPMVREAAIAKIGRRQIADARSLLQQARNQDPDASVRLAAERALALIGTNVSESVIVVMPFDGHGDAARFLGGIEDTFTACLATSGLATVVERRQLSAVMEEMRFAERNIDTDRALDVGRRLAANEVLTGSVTQTGDRLAVIVKRIDMATLGVLDGAYAVGSVFDVPALARDACNAFKRGFH